MSILGSDGFTAPGAPPFSSTLPQVRSICAAILQASAATQTPAEIRSLLEESVFSESPVFQGPQGPQTRRLALDYVDRRIADGVLPLFAQHGLAMVVELTGHPQMTPAQFEAQLDLALEESRPFFDPGLRGIRAVNPGALRFAPRNPLLRKSVELFAESGLSLYAASPEAVLDLYIPSLAASLDRGAQAGVLATNRAGMGGEVAMSLMSGVERYGCYNPTGEKPGIYMASYFPLATAPDLVQHEFAHVAQDRTWDYLALVDIFHSQFRPHIQNLPEIPKPGLIQLEIRMEHFIQFSRHAEYRRSVAARGKQLGFTTQEWTVFLDVCRYLEELDAHQQEFIAGQERGRSGVILANFAAIHEQILAVYQKKSAQITPMFYSISNNGPLFQHLVDWLNQNRRAPTT